MNKYDIIFIPGGGLLPDGSLPAWTLARLDQALALKDQTHWVGLLSGGTVHKPPPLDKTGFPVFESRAAAKYLIKKGLSPAKILTEICSYDTIGNAYFSRLLFADTHQLERILIITSEFHMARVREIFKWIYELTPLTLDYELSFESVANEGLADEEVAARESREERSINNVRHLRSRIKTIKDCTNWIYTEHDAYTPESTKSDLSDLELKSY